MADIEYTGDVYTQLMGGRVMHAGQAGQAVQDGHVAGDPAAPDPFSRQMPSDHAPAPAPSALGATVSFFGAMASVALVVGVGVWGYKLMVRDVSGVPVVRALAGPMRIQPDNPGGLQADHQGLAVNAVAAGGTAAPTADRLMLAPRPVELTDEDRPKDRTTPQRVSLDLTPEQSAQQAAQQSGSSRVDTPTATAQETMEVDALVEQLTAGVEPMSGKESPIGTPQTPASDEIAALGVSPQIPTSGIQESTGQKSTGQKTGAAGQPAVLTGPGLTHSLRPRSRPARAVGTQAAASADLASAITAAISTVTNLDVDPDSLATGTRLAQLGAYDSPEIARAEWDRLAVKFTEYLEDKQRVIQVANSGGRTFYRLRAMGFDDLSAARRFCSALVSENADCIPVTIR